MSISLKNARFIAGAAQLHQAPADFGHEVAFVGRSNSGKSSAINAITHNSKLARVSKQPGRTQQINFFEVTELQRIVDLPGYGFAKAPLEMRESWTKLIEAYISQRESLSGLILVADVRRGITELDWTLLEWCSQVSVPVHVLLSKSDKLSRSAAALALRTVHKVLAEANFAAELQLFSAVTGVGLAQVQGVVSYWLRGEKNEPRLKGGKPGL
ncbi:MAG: YihA family ribosome biogenesis GTP-binding protein [Gammaproteobacteria bacterium]|nr:YihA family ribosome biogenesis GTP-binding protein [Gammaproteobacteria bacterium]